MLTVLASLVLFPSRILYGYPIFSVDIVVHQVEKMYHKTKYRENFILTVSKTADSYFSIWCNVNACK